MQFGIGGRAGDTWSAYGVDGDGNGTVDVYDQADAVPAAADYLCGHGGGDPARLSDAVFAYNHADWYVADVLAQAAAYTVLPTPTAATGTAEVVIAFAESKLGLPYQWGGAGPLYDCSGLTQAGGAAAGVRMRRTSREQFWDGTRVALGELQAGDLVFYASDVTARRRFTTYLDLLDADVRARLSGRPAPVEHALDRLAVSEAISRYVRNGRQVDVLSALDAGGSWQNIGDVLDVPVE